MDQFTSPSDARNFYKDAYSTFQGMAVDAEGALITAERKGARASVTKKGLVVRYPSPFVGGEPEILFEHTKSLSSTATWKAHKIGAEGGHFQIGVVKDTLLSFGRWAKSS